ncbi:MAG: flippase activity-associated protein Agl23, partial [Dehalococcoidia bacterium]
RARALLPLDRLVGLRLRLTWDEVVIALLFLTALILRFYELGDRAIHHDESLHAVFSWYLYKGLGYIHDPLMHGPFLFHAMALNYGLFGVGEATARFVPAFLGSVLVLLPLLIRHRLGRWGTLAACVLLTFSPTLLYFSRFVGAGAQDIVLAVTAMLIVAGIWRYLDDGRSRWLFLIAGALSVSFATKEVTFIIVLAFILWLNGLVAADLAAQRHPRGLRRWAETLAVFPFAWLIATLWPFIGSMLARRQIAHRPRSADLLLVLGLFTAPQFAAAVQVPLERIGYDMTAPSQIGGLSNEALFGGATVGLLIAATTIAGIAWRPRDFLIAAAVFWGIYTVLYTGFFTNFEGFATGIWGSLDYWLEQQGEERGQQPIFYYAVLTPVYEYLALILAAWGIARTALISGRWTALALAVGIGGVLLGVIFGDGNTHGAPFAVLALLALVLALRRDHFRSFVAFWGAAVFFGLSVAGEKMPWLEVHIALPLALLAALTVNDLVAGYLHARPRAQDDAPAVPLDRTAIRSEGFAAIAGLAALTAAALLIWPGDTDGQLPFVLAALAVALVAAIVAGVRSRALGALSIAAVLIALLLPLTIRDGIRATFINSDTPHDLLIYTQTSPRLDQLAEKIDELARVSGEGHNLPIMIDTSDAFTWPWAWYLRDYKNVTYVDLTTYPRQDLANLRRPSVLVALTNNAPLASTWPGAFGPGERFPHRWWFPEEAYRSATGPRFWEWLRQPEMWSTWLDFYLHRTVPFEIGSIEAVAFFPPDFVSQSDLDQQAAATPRRDGDRLIVGGLGARAGMFNRPSAMAIDPDGNLLVADTSNNRIQKLSPTGEFIGASPPNVGLNEPWGVAADGSGNVFVADTWNHRIVQLDSGLRFVRAWGGPSATGQTADPAPLELYGPRGLAIDGDGNLWVTDTGHNRVLKFSPDGEPLGQFGGPGSEPGQFSEPVGIALASGGDILVADTWNGRVQRFDSAFQPIGSYQIAGWEDGNTENKPYVAELAGGSVLVSVPDGGRIEAIGADGRGRTSWDGFGEAGKDIRPVGVAVDGRGRIWVADSAGSTLIRLPAP